MLNRQIIVALNDEADVASLSDKYGQACANGLTVVAHLTDGFMASEPCWKALTASTTPWVLPEGDWSKSPVIYLSPRPAPVVVEAPATTPKKR